MGSVRRAIVLLFAACRLGFDGSEPAADGATDAAATVALCNPRSVATLALDSTGGHVHVASSLDSAELHLPLTPGLLARRVVADRRSHVKLLDPTFDTYVTIDNGDDLAIARPTASRANGVVGGSTCRSRRRPNCTTFLVDDTAAAIKLHSRPGCSERAMMVYRNAPTAMTLYAVPEDEAQTGGEVAR